MITLRVRDFRGCEAAEIELDPIALVAGRNANGKSSLAAAAGALLTGNSRPLGRNVAPAAYVREGTKEAAAYLKGEGGMVHIEWPGAGVTADGTPPRASAYAAELASIVDFSAPDRAKVLSQYLHADPDRADLAAALTEVDLGADSVVSAVWQLIEDHGFDGAHSIRRDKGVELKAAWRGITKQNYGSRIGVTWAPAGWTLDLNTATEADLLAAVAQTKHEHEQAIGAAAVSLARRQELEAEAAQLDARKDALREAEAAAELRARERDHARDIRAALPPGNVDGGMPCPHCGAFVVLRRINVAESRLEKAEIVPQDELKARQMAIADADGQLSNLEGQVRAADQAVEQARARMQMSAEAANKLAQFPAAAGDAKPTEATGQAVITSEARLVAWRAKNQADWTHVQIAGNEKLLEILSPDGLRAKKLARVLDLFNTQLAEYARFADWAPVTIAGDISVSYGGRPYELLSTSEQYRTRILLQISFAILDKSDMVVIDAADVLDGPTRGGLFALLEEVGISALVCMTLSRREQVPDLDAAGIGKSYWIEGGTVADLSDLTNAVAA